MPRLLVSVVMLLTLPALTACTLMRTEATFRYEPQSLILRMPSGLMSGARLTGVVVDDARYREDKRDLVNKRNGYDQRMSGVWAADRPLGEYTRQAFEDRISERSFRSTRFKLLMGASVALVRRDSGQEVWKDLFVARSPVNAR